MTSSVEKLKAHLMDSAVKANLALGIALANNVQLFKSVSVTATQNAPAHFTIIAAHAHLKPRYTKELLALLACGEILEVTKDGEHFYIPYENVDVLLNPLDHFSCAVINFFPHLAHVFQEIAQVLRCDGPLGMDYSAYTNFYKLMSDLSISMHQKHLLSDMIPVTGMKEKLEKGIKFMDVGCGDGYHVVELAKAFPNSKFTGVDLTQSAIEQCLERQRENGLTNTNFVQCNAKAMNPSWSDTFDMVMIFDACHDQCRADLAVKEIYRVLKPGGMFAMVEVDATSNIYQDKRSFGSTACVFYGFSVFHCLAVGSNSEDAIGLGTMMGTKKGIEMIHAAGFKDVIVKDIPFFKHNILYISKK